MSPLPRFASAGILGLALATTAIAAYDFGPWPAGTSPQEIGQRVADNFVAKPHSNFNRPGPPNRITYPEACTWFGALQFADVTKNEKLRGQLVERFEPLFREEKKLLPIPDHVDHTMF